MGRSSASMTRKGEQRKAQLLDAALLLFGQKGYLATTMDDIAKACGTGKGTVYWYWDSKEEIFRDLVRTKFEAYGAALAQAVAMPVTAPEKLVLLVSEVMHIFDKYRKFCKLIFILMADDGNRFSPEIHQAVRDFYASFRAVIAGIIDQGQQEGTIRPEVDRDAFASLMITVLDGFIMQESLMDTPCGLDRLAATLLSMFRHGMYQPYPPKTQYVNKLKSLFRQGDTNE